MKKVGAIVLPLLVIGWFGVVMYPDLIPGHYETSYLLPMVVVFVLIRAISAQKNHKRAPARQGRTAATGSAAPTEPPVSAGPSGPAGPPTGSGSGSTPNSPAAPVPSAPATSAAPTPAPPAATGRTGVDDLAPELVARLRELRGGGRTVEAVELLREETGMELYEASRLIIGLDDRA